MYIYNEQGKLWRELGCLLEAGGAACLSIDSLRSFLRYLGRFSNRPLSDDWMPFVWSPDGDEASPAGLRDDQQRRLEQLLATVALSIFHQVAVENLYTLADKKEIVNPAFDPGEIRARRLMSTFDAPTPTDADAMPHISACP